MCNILVLVDFKGKDFVIYCGVSLIILNLFEFEIIVGCCVDEVELVVKG